MKYCNYEEIEQVQGDEINSYKAGKKEVNIMVVKKLLKKI